MSQRSSLFQLQKIDTKIDFLNSRILEIENILRSDKEIISSNLRIQTAKEEVRKLINEVKSIESEVSQLTEKMKYSEAALYGGKVKNPKELQDLQTEISSIKKRIGAIEEGQLNLMIELDEAENHSELLQNEHDILLTRKEKENTTLSTEKEQLENQLKVLQIERTTTISQIEPELLEKYLALRKSRSGIAVATVIDNACSACGNSLTSADIQIVKSSAPEYYCKMCGRILYYG